MPAPLPHWLNAFAVELRNERPDVAFADVDRSFLEDLHRRGVSPAEAVRSRLAFVAPVPPPEPVRRDEEPFARWADRLESFFGPRYLKARLWILVACALPFVALAIFAKIASSAPAYGDETSDGQASARPTVPSPYDRPGVRETAARTRSDEPALPNERPYAAPSSTLESEAPPEITRFEAVDGWADQDKVRFTAMWRSERGERARLEIGSDSHEVEPSFGSESFDVPASGTCALRLTVTSRDGRTAQRSLTIQNGKVLPEGP